MTRPLAVRARLVPRAASPLERLHDPLIADLVHAGPFARERFPTLWNDTPALRRLAEAKLRPLPAELATELLAYHLRLGASAQSIAALEKLARGAAVAAIAGQQPAPLGGPMYSLHKTASSVALAASTAERTGVPCVPLFWMHGEDSDFAEVRSATFADTGLALHEASLPSAVHREGGLIGALAAAPLREISVQALAAWQGLPGHAEAERILTRSLAAARDHGEAASALMLALFADQGLVVIDPRLPAFRAAARPILDRYLAHAAELTAAARRGGDRLEERIGRRPLNDASLESFLFRVDDGVRHKIGAAEARERGAAGVLSPSVALRPVVQDGVLPTVAMACGAAEIAYLAQLREVFAGLGVLPACPVPRLTVTWLPHAAIELLEESGAEPWELVTGADHVLKRLAERAVPADLGQALGQARTDANAGLERFAAAAARLDSSLPQMVESARGKIDFQFARLLEGLTGKARHQLEKKHPEWWRVRYYLLPGDKLQERRLASLEVIARRGAGAVSEVCELALDQARRVAGTGDGAGGVHEHLLVEP